MRALVNVLIAMAAIFLSLLLLLLASFYAMNQGSWRVVLAAFVLASAAAWFHRRRDVRERAGEPTTRVEEARRFFVTAFVVSGVTAFAAFCAYGAGAQRPPQATIESNFREHRRDFEELRDMVRADAFAMVVDGGDRYARESSVPTPPLDLGISEARADDYRRRMASAGARRIDVRADGSVGLLVANWGTQHGWRIAVVWSEKEPAPLLPTIDAWQPGETTEVYRGPRKTTEAYGALGDHWYVHVW